MSLDPCTVMPESVELRMQNDASDSEDGLKVLDERIDALQANINGLNEELQMAKNKRNALRPVLRLPAEVLCRIFLQYRDMWWSWNWLMVTRVCQYWRNVALGYPSLWTNLRNINSADKLRTFLERSRKAELSVTLSRMDNKFPYPEGYLELFKKHMKRVKSFSLWMDRNSDWDRIQNLLKGSMRRLKKLDLYVAKEDDYYQPTMCLDILAMSNVKLEELSLTGIYLPWDRPIFHGLSKLSLSDIADIHHRPTFSELLNILEACPNLLSLELSGIGPSQSLIVESTPVQLLRLEDIDVSLVDIDVCIELFNCIIIPKQVSWSVFCRNYPFNEPEPFISKLMECAMQYDTITITFSQYFLSFRSRSYKEKPCSANLSFSWNRSPFLNEMINSAFASIGTIFGQLYWSNMTMIHITMIDLSDEETMLNTRKTAWSHLFALFTIARSLHIQFPLVLRHNVSLEEGLIAALVEIDNADPCNYRCPLLEDLTIANAIFSGPRGVQIRRKLVKHLQHRGREGKRLKTVSLNGCSGIDENEVKKIEKWAISDEIMWDEDEEDG